MDIPEPIKKPENPPAFARPGYQFTGPMVGGNDGMSLLDYFAAKALQSMVGAAAFNQKAEDMMKAAGIEGAERVEAFIAMMAYDFAYAMLAEREKRA